MDDYLDQCFTSSSWSDMNVKERSSWVHSEPDDQPDALLSAGSLGVYNQDDNKNSSPVRMLGSDHGTIGCLPEQDISPSLAPSAESGCGVDHSLLPGEGDGQICSGNS